MLTVARNRRVLYRNIPLLPLLLRHVSFYTYFVIWTVKAADMRGSVANNLPKGLNHQQFVRRMCGTVLASFFPTDSWYNTNISYEISPKGSHRDCKDFTKKKAATNLFRRHNACETGVLLCDSFGFYYFHYVSVEHEQSKIETLSVHLKLIFSCVLLWVSLYLLDVTF